MGIQSARNRDWVPDLQSEGRFAKPLVPASVSCKEIWSADLSSFDKKHYHNTLASARRFSHFIPHPGLIPKDGLDYCLSATYNHSREIFPEPVDVYLQPDTLGLKSWRRLKNTTERHIKHRYSDIQIDEELVEKIEAKLKREHPPEDDDLKHNITVKLPQRHFKIPHRYNAAHPVLIGGILEKGHPSNVKLMHSSHHSSQTNPGYSRQDSDGNVYQY